MNAERRTKLRSTLAAVIAALVMFGPDIVEAIDVNATSPGWLKALAKVAGLVIGLATSGKAVALVNLLLPEPKTQETKPAQEAPKS